MNKQCGRRYTLGSLLKNTPKRNKRGKGCKINSTNALAIKIVYFNLLLAKLVDGIFQQGLENQFGVLDILREVTFRLVTWDSQESISSFQSLHVYESALARTVGGKNVSAGSHPILISWHVE